MWVCCSWMGGLIAERSASGQRGPTAHNVGCPVIDLFPEVISWWAERGGVEIIIQRVH